MKKLFVFLCLLFIPQVCLGEEEHWVNENGEEVSDEEVGNFIFDNVSDAVKEQAKEMEVIYESMNTCMPAKSQYMQIFGYEGNLCHFKYVDYDCLLPQDVAAEYSELGLKIAEEMYKGNISTESPENIRIQEILSNKDYCSYEMTWTATMEDEDGNEVPVEVINVK